MSISLSKENLKLSHGEGEDAGDGRKYKPLKGDFCSSLWAIGSNSKGDQDKVEEPLDAILAEWLAQAFLHSQGISCEMVWTKVSR